MNNYQKGYTKILAITGLLSVAILTGYLLTADSDTSTHEEPQIQTEISITGDKQTGEQLQITVDGLETSNEIQKYEWDLLETDGGDEITTNTGETITHIFDEAGPKTIQLEIEDTQGHTENTNKIIEVEEEIDEVYLAHLEPSGEELDGPTADFEFYTEVPGQGYKYEMEIGRETETITGSLEKGKQTTKLEDIEIRDSGRNIDYRVDILDEEDNIEDTQTETINIARAWEEFVEINNIGPKDGEDDHEQEGSPRFSAYYDALEENSWFRVIIDGETKVETSVAKGSEQTSFNVDIEDPGSYSWYFEIEAQETDEIFQTEPREVITEKEPTEDTS